MTIRTIVVSPDEAGLPVAVLLKKRLSLSWAHARRLVEQKRVRQGSRLCRDAQSRVRVGQKLRIQADDKVPKTASKLPVRKQQPRNTKPASKPTASLRYADEHVVVVEKPAGLTTMRHAHEAAEFGERSRRFLPATLADILPDLLASRGKPARRVIPVHRLDRDTSGLVVFALSAAAARHLGAQFREHTTERTYLAVVRGRAMSERIESRLVADRGDGRRGSSSLAGARDGQTAITHVRVVEDLGEYTLVECQLETGRTHQVRIHLGERGTPICGERIYDRPLHGPPLPDHSAAQRLALHAATLSIAHPLTGKRMRWTAALPPDMERLLRLLRERRIPPLPGGKMDVH